MLAEHHPLAAGQWGVGKVLQQDHLIIMGLMDIMEAILAVMGLTLFMVAGRAAQLQEPPNLLAREAFQLWATLLLGWLDQPLAAAGVALIAHQQQLLAQSQAEQAHAVKLEFGQLGDDHAKS
jgi:hypothetical protein